MADTQTDYVNDFGPDHVNTGHADPASVDPGLVDPARVRSGRIERAGSMDDPAAETAVSAPAGGSTPSARSGSRSHTGAFATRVAHRRYLTIVIVLAVLAIAVSFGLLAWANPMPVGSQGFWTIARRRMSTLVVIGVVAFSQALATVAFQTITNNRIITPSIMGFESLYRAVQTSAVYFLGVAGVVALQGVPQFLVQVGVMVVLAVILYGTLLSGRYANLQVMLLIGIVIGAGLGSVATFMQRMLSPSEFDVLSARMFGNISNAEASYLPVAVPLCLAAGLGLWVRSQRLNVMALGASAATGLGLNHRRETMVGLTLVSVLIAVSTALVGPMTFFGFLVATLTYSLAGTHDHRRIFPVAVLTGFVVLAGAYFVMRYVFYAQGMVSVIIELVGGTTFLIVLLRKGRL